MIKQKMSNQTWRTAGHIEAWLCQRFGSLPPSWDRTDLESIASCIEYGVGPSLDVPPDSVARLNGGEEISDDAALELGEQLVNAANTVRALDGRREFVFVLRQPISFSIPEGPILSEKMRRFRVRRF